MKKEFKYRLRRVVFLYTPFIIMWNLMFILYFCR